MMPMEHGHFQFIKNGGVFHYIIQDLPHVVISGAALINHVSSDDIFSVSAWLVFAFSLSSIVIGVLHKLVQMAALRSQQRRTQLRASLVGEMQGMDLRFNSSMLLDSADFT